MLLNILLIAHLLADFSLQTAKLAEKKLESFKHLLLHALIYAAVFAAAIFPLVKPESTVLPYIIIVFSHFIIDWVRTVLDNKSKSKGLKFAAFLFDQALHLLILAGLYYIFDLAVETTPIYENIARLPLFNNLVIYTLIFVIIWDTAGVFIKKLFSYICAEEESAAEPEQDKTEWLTFLGFNDPAKAGAQAKEYKIGRIIGKLERLLIAVLVLYNQFAAVGFVLTAKSIARYKQLEDKNFAEKYLVGTLTSVAIAFIATLVLKQYLV